MKDIDPRDVFGTSEIGAPKTPPTPLPGHAGELRVWTEADLWCRVCERAHRPPGCDIVVEYNRVLRERDAAVLRATAAEAKAAAAESLLREFAEHSCTATSYSAADDSCGYERCPFCFLTGENSHASDCLRTRARVALGLPVPT